MAFWPLRLLWKVLRIAIGLVLVGWGLISFIIFILPGGLWTLFIGLAILAIDIPFVRRFNEWLRVKIQRRFPRFYRKCIAPLDATKERGIETMKRWRERLRNSIWPMLILGAFVLLVAGVLPLSALEIEHAGAMPHPLDEKFIAEIWQEVIRVTNAEAPILKVDENLSQPRIGYAEAPATSQEKTMAETDAWVDKYGQILLERSSFAITIYRAAFFRHLPEWMAGGEGQQFFPEQAYGVVAHEFFHKTLSYQYISGDNQHCTMIFRGTLKKVLQFIDKRLGTGTKVTEAVMAHVQGQCEKDSGGRVRFP